MRLPGNEDGGPGRRPAPACNATALLGLDRDVYLVGTLDGVVYVCAYDEPTKYTSRTVAHLGAIRSLEKSPYADHVYLTTGCDCTVNVWAADAVVEPVIALRAGRQIERAVWSRTSSTVIVSLIGESRTSVCIHRRVYQGVARYALAYLYFESFFFFKFIIILI